MNNPRASYAALPNDQLFARLVEILGERNVQLLVDGGEEIVNGTGYGQLTLEFEKSGTNRCWIRFKKTTEER